MSVKKIDAESQQKEWQETWLRNDDQRTSINNIVPMKHRLMTVRYTKYWLMVYLDNT